MCVVSTLHACGHAGIPRAACELRGCCWQQPHVAGPVCYRPRDFGASRVPASVSKRMAEMALYSVYDGAV